MSEALTRFFAMGGYAVYVWGSFGVFAAVLVWNIVAPRRARNGVMRQLTETDEAAPGDHE
ncbi:heme exporter protein CcmD [Hydrocarboniphaga sp.]|uniref:heme exporter protein CcmD n=1 Tax=Hydrocarboniphaga sp. TaxID=2033016 RepID=UPI003D0A8211